MDADFLAALDSPSFSDEGRVPALFVENPNLVTNPLLVTRQLIQPARNLTSIAEYPQRLFGFRNGGS